MNPSMHPTVPTSARQRKPLVPPLALTMMSFGVLCGLLLVGLGCFAGWRHVMSIKPPSQATPFDLLSVKANATSGLCSKPICFESAPTNTSK